MVLADGLYSTIVDIVRSLSITPLAPVPPGPGSLLTKVQRTNYATGSFREEFSCAPL